ncbi:type VI secretion system baseplate subunit TssF [Bermanella marisrubri]|uniref:Uncharacterized protein n=1 Tax=Bermanella marisrubri TaxID=207949 RepID=Q1N517_9GAMM|nr:type VI secretion system baseplate subunit TssF [Bermanella marisrubri]EAT13261.1 hypothetical protein RED65_00835 [Oceanobacter sp. RED65] [Bermanella marisrubri]QIZ84028.1 type VI secretion system baseplate subunit TssF [Bermanella marisrubri]
MKLESYQTELQALKEGARDFAKKYPALAPHLAGTSNDPDVERILQGTAYLSAGIQERLDEDFPEFAQSILRLVAPDYLKEIPSTSIIEFKPRNILNNAVTIKSASKLDSQKVLGSSCRFQTCIPVTVYPLAVNAVELIANGQQTDLDVVIHNTSISNADVTLSELPIHLSGDYATASQLYYLLSKKLVSVSIVQGSNITHLPDAKLESLGWKDDFSMLESGKTQLNSYRKIQEYFINKYKFLFLNVTGLDKDVPLPKAFKLRFKLNSKVEGLKVDNSNIKLFCAPAINLFDTTAEPVPLDHRQSDLKLKPIRNTNNQFSIYSVLDVLGQNRRSNEKTQYLDFSLMAKQQSQQPVYELVQKAGDQGETDSLLRVNFPEGKELPTREVITANIRCSNGPLPQRLKVGDINVNTPDVADLVSFANISSVTEYIPPQTDGRVLWNLLAHLTVNYLPLADLNNLKVLLNLYNPTNQADAKEKAANAKRIESLTQLVVEPADRLLRGQLVRGRKVLVTMDGTGFSSQGDLFVFGELLNNLYTQFTDLNSFIELCIVNENTGEEMTWQPSQFVA